MIRVYPNTKFRVDRILCVDEAIVISAVLWLVIDG